MRRFLKILVLFVTIALATPAMALDCEHGYHTQHQITLKGMDGKLSYWGLPRERATTCVPGRRNNEVWVLDGFPGEYKSAEDAVQTMRSVQRMLGKFTEEEWLQVVAFVKQALTEGTQGGELFAKN